MNKTLVGFDNTDGTLQAVYLIDYEYISCANYDWAFDVTEEQASILVNSGDVKNIIGQVTGDDVGWFLTLDEAENMRK